jgi:serine/threonine-protein phosphatase 2A regulatory subunit B'
MSVPVSNANTNTNNITNNTTTTNKDAAPHSHDVSITVTTSKDVSITTPKDAVHSPEVSITTPKDAVPHSHDVSSTTSKDAAQQHSQDVSSTNTKDAVPHSHDASVNTSKDAAQHSHDANTNPPKDVSTTHTTTNTKDASTNTSKDVSTTHTTTNTKDASTTTNSATTNKDVSATKDKDKDKDDETRPRRGSLKQIPKAGPLTKFLTGEIPLKPDGTGQKSSSSRFLNLGPQEKLERLPALKAVPPAEREALFIKKLKQASVVFDFTKAINLQEAEQKEIKRETLQELVDFLITEKIPFSAALHKAAFDMLAANLFRPLPPKINPEGEAFDPEDDEPILEAAWPHVQIVYDFFLRT